MRALLTTALFFYFFVSPLIAEPAPPYKAAEVYTNLRKQLLNLDDKKIAELAGKSVWAVMMETGHENSAISVIAIADGTASLYYSTGGGMIGLGENSNIRSATLSFVKKSTSFLQFMKRVDVFPLPKPEQTVFYLVTPKGVFSYEAARDDLGKQHDKLSALYYSGHELIAQIRIADQKRKIK